MSDNQIGRHRQPSWPVAQPESPTTQCEAPPPDSAAPHAGGSAESTASQPPPGHPDPWAWDAPALSPKPEPEPEPELEPDPAPAARPAGDPVPAVLDAAGVKPDPMRPRYWHRHEHRAELEAMLDRCGVDLATALARLRAAPPAGAIRRIRDLEPTIAQADRTDRKSGRNADGTFTPGNAGKPRGTLHKATRAALAHGRRRWTRTARRAALAQTQRAPAARTPHLDAKEVEARTRHWRRARCWWR